MDSRRKEQDTILDRHNRAIAQILTRFRSMVMSASEPLPVAMDSGQPSSGAAAAIESAALNSMAMETHTAAFITEIENLLAINREIKSLWIRGPLRQTGEDSAIVNDIDRKAEVVTGLVNQIMALRDSKLASNSPHFKTEPH